MRIGVISDTHGKADAISRAVLAAGPVDMWLHAGDFSQDAALLAELSGLPVTAVAGNCDGAATALVDEFVEVCGKRIWLTHGHRYDARHRPQELVWWGQKYEADAVVYGHTHVPDVTWSDSLLIFNPGSAARPRGGYPASFGILEIFADGTIKPEIIDLTRQ